MHENTLDPNQKHPVEYIEPIEETPRFQYDANEFVKKLFDVIYPNVKLDGKPYYLLAFRRFVVMTSIIRPDLTKGHSQTLLAKYLECTPATFSKQANQIADILGMRSASMKPESSRANYASGQHTRRANGDNPNKKQSHAKAIAAAAESARSKIGTRVLWTKFEVSSLIELGYIDNDRKLTGSGEKFFKLAHPPLGNPCAGDLIGGDSSLGQKA